MDGERLNDTYGSRYYRPYQTDIQQSLAQYLYSGDNGDIVIGIIYDSNTQVYLR